MLAATSLLVWEATVQGFGLWSVLASYSVVLMGALLLSRRATRRAVGSRMFAYLVSASTALALHACGQVVAA